jgi:hypothetical protein
MSIEISDETGRGARPWAREVVVSLLAIPKDHPLLFAVAWTTLLLGLCLAPARIMPDENSLTIKRHIPFTDLAVHFTLFAGFVLSWLRVGRSPRRWLAVPAIGLLLAAGTELAQGLPFIQRDSNLLDAFANAFGVLVGLVGSAIRHRRSVGQPASNDLP